MGMGGGRGPGRKRAQDEQLHISGKAWDVQRSGNQFSVPDAQLQGAGDEAGEDQPGGLVVKKKKKWQENTEELYEKVLYD